MNRQNSHWPLPFDQDEAVGIQRPLCRTIRGSVVRNDIDKKTINLINKENAAKGLPGERLKASSFRFVGSAL